ncbi:hypothetical protein MML61_03750 [Mycobacterium marinum]|uniref:hypothetical protein n=1 Tax=Mycobacterium marinum TaxID=1781 RepID=UPI00235967CA|nr:hypothetical protein [Mycobacterium marinum]WCS19027.1 hypothetical protein MML61_03750 [Mycobacterium marinum]
MAKDDLDSNPGTEPFVPEFDTGERSVPFVPDFDTDSKPFAGLAAAVVTEPKKSSVELVDLSEALAPLTTLDRHSLDGDSQADGTATPAPSVTVPSRYVYLKWWKFVLVVLGVWFGAAQVGLSLFYWWFHTIDKTLPVFVVLVYLVLCAVASLLLSMVQGRPLITALSLALMSAPFASVAAAAPLYGSYFCEHASRCLVGVIPY